MPKKNIIKIHYNRILKDYPNWSLWIWDTISDFSAEIFPSSEDDFGLVFELDLNKLPLKNKLIGLLPKYKDWALKDIPERIYLPSMPGEIYLLENDKTIHSSLPDTRPKIEHILLDSENTIRLILDRTTKKDFIDKHPILLKTDEKTVKITDIHFPHNAEGKVIYLKTEPLKISDYPAFNKGSWTVEIAGIDKKPVYLGNAVYGKYFHTNKELGVIFHNELTVFRVFAPFAWEVTLIIEKESNAKPKELNLDYTHNGVWQLKSNENLLGQFYRYRIRQKGKVTEGIDPYAKAVTAHNDRGIITDDKTFVSECPEFKHSESIIYELHIRDFTIDSESGVKHKGKYLGMSEENTFHSDYKNMKTGLGHLKELGVNTVQIMPVADFENEENKTGYRWGYMPVNFNSPEGWYATETGNDSRVKELKTLINTLHKNGIKVVLDVVYNHTAEGNHEIIYNFNALALNYYYRQKPDETYHNGSGCGNEFKSESPMGRKFIIDSLAMWAKEYKVDGFRFDLMGLTDLETIETAIKELKKINPALIFYGEPWTAGETPITAIQKGSQKHKGFGVFNDTFRDAVKGSVFSMERGFAQGGKYRDKTKRGIAASIDDFCASPLETINYTSCHDGHTLFDRIVLSTKGNSLAAQIKMSNLANAIILTSQGIPFLHSGSEILRSKKGEHNSYNKPDIINKIYWNRKKRFEKVFNFYKGLIELRKTHPAFRMKNAKKIRQNLNFYEEIGLSVMRPSIAYILNGYDVSDSWKKIVVLINPTQKEQEFVLPEGSYGIAVRNDIVSLNKPLGIASQKIIVPEISLMILHQNFK